MKQRKPMGYWNQPIEAIAIVHPPEDANGANGYIRVSRNNQVEYLHRLIWEELVGPIPAGMEVDHKNGIKTDCRLTNLRLVTSEHNKHNLKKRTDNTSGVTGVSFWKAGNAWRAVVIHPVTKKQQSTTFSVTKYGHDDAFMLACDARAEGIRLLNQQGAAYTQRHGT
ncbi:putative HNH endonuclease [Burkholderia phage vB_BpP_HN03]